MVGAIIQAVAQTTQVITNVADKSADRKQERLNLQYEATKDKQQLTPTKDYTNYLFWGLGIIGGILLLGIIFKKT